MTNVHAYHSQYSLVHFASQPLPVSNRDMGACLLQIDFWRQELAGAPELLALPAAQPRPQVASGEGCNIPFNVSPQLLRSIRQLARDRGCTLIMFFTAVYQVRLHPFPCSEMQLYSHHLLYCCVPGAPPPIPLLRNAAVLS